MAATDRAGHNSAGEAVGERSPPTLPVGLRTGAAAWITVWRVLEKLGIELSHEPVIPLLGIYPKNLKTFICKGIWALMSLQHYSRWPRHRHDQSVLQWVMDKEGVVHTYNGIWLGPGKDEALPFAMTWMDLETMMLSEIS